MAVLTASALKIELYKKMLRIRMVEEKIIEKYSEQKMRCPVHLSIGQEAVAVGVLHHFKTSDYLFSTHRAHAHYLAKGGDLKAMIAEIYGKESGCSKGRGGSMHLVDLSVGVLGTTPIVGGSIPVGVGAAFGSHLKGINNLTIIFFGEGATEEGAFSEALNFAALKNLPILFLCENNLYSVYSPLSVRQAANRDRLEIAKAHGIAGNSGFGNDVEEVLALTELAVNHLKNGCGPYYLEFNTYRYREHCGPNLDDNLGYRSHEEVEYWNKRCPIKLYEEKLISGGDFNSLDINKLKEELAFEINEAFEFAEYSAYPEFIEKNETPYA